MNLHDCLTKILNEWPNEIDKQFKNNSLADFIRNDFLTVVSDLVPKEYIIKSSAGAGNWANIPWLSILDKKITDTTQEGIYPVFLFRADGSGVYLSLNQGTSTARERLGKAKAQQQENIISAFLNSRIKRLENWDSNPLILKANTELGKSYQNSNIGSKFYSTNSLPSNDIMVEDLKTITKIYQETVTLLPEIKKLTERQQTIPRENKNMPLVTKFIEDLKGSGLVYSSPLSYRFISALQTKPFVIFTGLSGSGKTKLAEAFSLWITEEKVQTCMVAVGADWTNREPLLGFPNALEKGHYVKPESGALDLIINACNDPQRPYFLILDEMNMSHVERYFADFLSAMESASGEIALHPDTDDWVDCDVPASICLPSNLFIIGTVNIDETTYMFSPKVLDRANVIEFRVSGDEMADYFDSPSELDLASLDGAGASMATSFVDKASEKGLVAEGLGDVLIPFFKQLSEVRAEFGYRTASEMSRFVKICGDLAEDNMTDDDVIDSAIIQKLLPKLHGSRNKIEQVLITLGGLCLEHTTKTSNPFSIDNNAKLIKYPLSYQKLKRMHQHVLSDGFTSFPEA